MPWPHGEPAPDPALTRAYAACAPSGRLAGPLRAYRSIPTTQALARAWADAGAPEGAVVLAEHQTAGRGRRGRTWTAPPGQALLVSVVLRPGLPVARWPEIALAAGCAVAEGVERVTGLPPALKWPNDVLIGERKVAGILAEGVAGPTPWVVLGLGVNVSQPDGAWPPELRGRATSLAAEGADVSCPALLAAVLERMEAWYGVLETRGFDPVREAWRSRGRLGGRARFAGQEGVALDLAPGGGLVVRRDDGRLLVVVAGDDDEKSTVRPPALETTGGGRA